LDRCKGEESSPSFAASAANVSNDGPYRSIVLGGEGPVWMALA
jgi:hypothetical protein